MRQTGVNVFGDSVNAGNTYNYWGQHLSQNSGPVNSNALWQQQNYSFNKDTQAYWNSGKNQAMSDAIARLMQNATKLQTAAISSSFDGVCWNLADKCSQLDQYPDGRVWYWNGPVSIGGGINYSKKATIVVNNGDLTINGNLLSTDQISSLGFIVESGNAIIQNETNPHKKISINASFFVPKGTIQIIGNDIDLTGSFVADDFNVSGSDINFIQDTRGESAWPPGFRDLQSLASISK
ncbi:MAG: hypothetical protein NTY30_00445 [Candidatus Berkelbacteria bacterium]|nr:hypothetical protein [Candidatus Berkelbacteria bacterium]